MTAGWISYLPIFPIYSGHMFSCIGISRARFKQFNPSKTLQHSIFQSRHTFAGPHPSLVHRAAISNKLPTRTLLPANNCAPRNPPFIFPSNAPPNGAPVRVATLIQKNENANLTPTLFSASVGHLFGILNARINGIYSPCSPPAQRP